MQISSIALQSLKTPYLKPVGNKPKNALAQNNSQHGTSLPIGFNTSYNINFTAWTNPNRLVGDVDLESYHIMTERSKERYRKLYASFSENEEVDQTKLFDVKSKKLPLTSDEAMEKFIETSKIYLNYKDQPIICLGRSPKWFLNTAFWMKDGVPEYKFVAFSRYWYYPIKDEMKLIKSDAPTKEEESAYRNYLDRIGADPKTIVETMRNEGKKTVITDYICTGKGACSFLDIMARYANDLGILEEFSKSIEFVGIGSMEYLEDLHPYCDEALPMPRVPMPPILEPYGDNIKQTFYDMDYEVFNEMLLNQNTNECRSTYYPHDAWTVYSPDKFKTGLIRDMSKVEKLLEIFKNEKYITAFTAPMQDYRNLLNFRILDYLNSKGLLRTPIWYQK
ncbi:MAG: hypothetical protein IKL52_00360 [Candidatus Gastranaerophilales bacterium]|nr:hypothetical protein [Candidatus Gastranaerophilales bacterium]